MCTLPREVFTTKGILAMLLWTSQVLVLLSAQLSYYDKAYYTRVFVGSGSVGHFIDSRWRYWYPLARKTFFNAMMAVPSEK